MNVPAHSLLPTFPRSIVSPRPKRRGGFALIVTLLILSLLIVVAVSYLTSMSSERQTANAYTSAARAEQIAQSGVDSAMAMLQESFRDFPDSATVWDTTQSQNSGASANYNEGTSLYLRAMPMPAPAFPSPAPGQTVPTVVANPQPDPSSTAANDPAGNNPSNPACENFVLPLISGVPLGRAQLVTAKIAGGMLPTMNVTVTDPTQQNFTDLNVRRYAGDTQGYIGSPPTASTPSPTSTPKPARALWVNQKDSGGLTTGRYAFWIEDESFRVNANAANASSSPIPTTTSTTRVDNGPNSSTQKYPINPTTKQPYIVTPLDAGLSGALSVFDGTAAATSDAQSVLNTRAVFPGNFLPDPLAFSHSTTSGNGATALATPAVDGIRYLTTTQSGTLDLTRHGTERLNLNTAVIPVDLSGGSAATKAIQNQINQIFATLQFHLPNFGQRFYRTSTQTDSTTLNATQVVYNSTLKSEGIGDPNLIYLYKVAANIRDYLDNDAQPTLILAGGTVNPIGPPPLYPFGDDGQPNPMWAVGKESTPFLQETAVRFRPVAPPSKGTYTLAVDYYLEFWNMTDHDINGSDLNSPQIHVSDQQTWNGYPSGIPLTAGSGTPPVSPYNDLSIDVSNVVFRAGAATVITTDPDYKSYTYLGPPSSTVYKSLTGPPNPNTTFLCPLISGTRTFAGPLPNQGTANADYGLAPVFRDGTQDYHTEITFFNKYGYLDCALFSLAEGGSPVFTSTDKYVGTPGSYNDYSYGGSLYGNSIASEMGDPRTNNEQMIFHRISGAGSGDLSRYYNGNHTLGYQDANYVQPVGGSFTPPGGSSTVFIAWPDYYTWPSTSTDLIDLNAANTPAVIADQSLVSIGQLGDVYDPARITTTGTPETARGGGRTFKIGQRDDRVTYDPSGNPALSNTPDNTPDNIPASLGWASWRLTDIFSAGPYDSTNPTGPVQQPIELPGRVNINGVLRDGGAALRALLTGFIFQPATVAASSGTSEPLFHTPTPLAGTALSLQPTDSSGLVKLLAQMTARLTGSPPTQGSNIPWGPFFERGELGELQANGTTIFGTNSSPYALASNGLAGTAVDMNRTFDRGREELCRRLSEMICTRGDTFTVYAVGQSITQHDTQSALKINSTHRLRVTFRLVPMLKDANTGTEHPFHPVYTTVSDADPTIVGTVSYDLSRSSDITTRFAKPDRYDAQVLEVNVF